eukprot:617823-Rhodomonas_salina.4
MSLSNDKCEFSLRCLPFGPCPKVLLQDASSEPDSHGIFLRNLPRHNRTRDNSVCHRDMRFFSCRRVFTFLTWLQPGAAAEAGEADAGKFTAEEPGAGAPGTRQPISVQDCRDPTSLAGVRMKKGKHAGGLPARTASGHETQP